MVRTQMYLDEDLWKALHAAARAEKTTVSALIRQSVRERYFGNFEARRSAMRAFVGSRKNRRTSMSAVEEVRALRRGTRLERIHGR